MLNPDLTIPESEPARCVFCGSEDTAILSSDGPVCESCYTFNPVRAEAKGKPGIGPVVKLLRAEKPPGHSPYPCPRCRATVGIRVSYQGRREEWECSGCGHGWSMPATEEQSA